MAAAMAVVGLLFAVGCSDAGGPPVLGDPSMPTDSGMIPTTDAAAPCSTPAQGCPCDNPGEEVFCGMVYRISGKHVDCSKGYVTCQKDKTWGACEGSRIAELD